VIIGLFHLFLLPNPLEAVNEDAARDMVEDIRHFEATVLQTMRGGTFFGIEFPRMI